MADILEKENKEMRAQIAELEKSIMDYKDKYINIFCENHSNVEFIANLQKDHNRRLERVENDSKYRINKLENSLDNVRNFFDEELKKYGVKLIKIFSTNSKKFRMNYELKEILQVERMMKLMT